jgi:hypothetical protein
MPYTAVVLTEESRETLLDRFTRKDIPEGWDIKAHHMTIDLKPVAKSMAAEMCGQTIEIEVVSLGVLMTDFEKTVGIMALGVECSAPSKNDVKHITVAHHPEVKPKMSNEITTWTPISPTFTITGVVQEVA